MYLADCQFTGSNFVDMNIGYTACSTLVVVWLLYVIYYAHAQVLYVQLFTSLWT